MFIDHVDSGMPGSFEDKDVSTGGPRIPEDGTYSALPSLGTSSRAVVPAS